MFNVADFCMKNIINFLRKFSNITLTSRTIKKVVFDILKNKHIQISEDEIIYHNNVVYIKSNNIIKNEVFFIKESVLNEIKIKLKKEIVKDIR